MSHVQVERMVSSPLIASMGALATLIAHTIEHIQDVWLVKAVMEDILKFTAILVQQWRMNKLSAVDQAEDSNAIEQQTVDGPFSSLWKVLKVSLFAITVILKGVLACALNRKIFAKDECKQRHTFYLYR